MSNLDGNPLSTFFGAIGGAWGMVLCPAAAMLAGVALGMFAGGQFELSVGWMLGIMIAILPVVWFTSIWAFAVGLGMFAAALRFMLKEEGRFESLLALAELTGVQTFLLLGGGGLGILGWLRVLAAAAVLPMIYVALRLYARRKLLALERQIEADRRARMEQERELARLERERVQAQLEGRMMETQDT